MIDWIFFFLIKSEFHENWYTNFEVKKKNFYSVKTCDRVEKLVYVKRLYFRTPVTYMLFSDWSICIYCKVWYNVCHKKKGIDERKTTKMNLKKRKEFLTKLALFRGSAWWNFIFLHRRIVVKYKSPYRKGVPCPSSFFLFFFFFFPVIHESISLLYIFFYFSDAFFSTLHPSRKKLHYSIF